MLIKQMKDAFSTQRNRNRHSFRDKEAYKHPKVTRKEYFTTTNKYISSHKYPVTKKLKYSQLWKTFSSENNHYKSKNSHSYSKDHKVSSLVKKKI